MADDADQRLQQAVKVGKQLVCENTQLKDDLKSSERTVEKLKQELHDQKRKLETVMTYKDLASELEATQIGMDELRLKLDEKTTFCDKLEKSCASLKSQVSTLEEQSTSKDQKIGLLEEQLSQLEELGNESDITRRMSDGQEWININKKLTDLEEEKMVHLNNITGLKEELSRNLDEKNLACTRVEELETQNKDMSQECFEMRDNLEAYKEEVACLQAHVDGLSSAGAIGQKGNSLFAELDSRRLKAEKKFVTFQETIAALKKDLKITKMRLHHAQIQIAMNGAREDSSELVASLRDQLASDDAKNRELARCLEDTETKLEGMNQQYFEMEKLARMAATGGPSERMVSSLGALLDQERKNRDPLKEELEHANLRNRFLSDKLNDLGYKGTDRCRELSALKAANVKLSQKVYDLTLKCGLDEDVATTAQNNRAEIREEVIPDLIPPSTSTSTPLQQHQPAAEGGLESDDIPLPESPPREVHHSPLKRNLENIAPSPAKKSLQDNKPVSSLPEDIAESIAIEPQEAKPSKTNRKKMVSFRQEEGASMSSSRRFNDSGGRPNQSTAKKGVWKKAKIVKREDIRRLGGN